MTAPTQPSTLPPMQVLSEARYRLAVDQLAESEPILAAIVERWGAPPFWRHPEGFAGLVHGILAQQVSLESAVAAFDKLDEALGGVHPDGFLTLDDARLRAIGFSRQKTAYARGVAASIVDGSLDLDAVHLASNDDVRQRLLRLRGIGPWTADVYLLFSMCRADAWPSGDLALAIAVKELWEHSSRPDWDALDAFARRWRPYRAVAARLLWHDYLSKRGRRYAGMP